MGSGVRRHFVGVARLRVNLSVYREEVDLPKSAGIHVGGSQNPLHLGQTSPERVVVIGDHVAGWREESCCCSGWLSVPDCAVTPFAPFPSVRPVEKPPTAPQHRIVIPKPIRMANTEFGCFCIIFPYAQMCAAPGW